MDEPRLLKETLKDAMETQGCTIAKLAESTGVSETFIKTMLIEENHDAPPLPYARGYILKIAKELGLNGKDLWNAYVREFAPHGSGLTDEMPQNRFAIERMNIKRLALAGLGIIILGYLIFMSDRLVGSPHMTITNPGTSVLTTNIPVITIKGTIEHIKDMITINDVAIAAKGTGDFEKELALDHGTNIFIVRAKRLLGRAASQTITVIYEPLPPPPEGPPPTNDRVKKNEKPV